MNRKHTTVLVLAVLLTFLWLVSCRKDKNDEPGSDVVPAQATFTVPPGWPQPTYNLAGNPLTQAGFQLGRRLFYETRLSRDGTISCASCHSQFSGFSHLDHALSHGIYGLFGTRNAPGIFNMAWKTSFFWDGLETSLEKQPIHPIENPVEMDFKMADVITFLSGDAAYRTRFHDAFGDESITEDRVNKAFAQFMSTLVSSNSRYDKHVRGEAGDDYTDRERQGLAIFRQKCATCHAEPLFTDNSFRNNGLKMNSGLQDSGRIGVTKLATDRMKFMVPSLRNVALSRPYMHDGRFTTLEAVLEHYNSGIVPSTTLDTLLTKGIPLSTDEKSALVAFLKTLSDTIFTKDTLFSQPKNQ